MNCPNRRKHPAHEYRLLPPDPRHAIDWLGVWVGLLSFVWVLAIALLLAGATAHYLGLQ